MYCENCGSKLEEGALFCHECGQAVPQLDEAPKTVSAEEAPTQPVANQNQAESAAMASTPAPEAASGPAHKNYRKAAVAAIIAVLAIVIAAAIAFGTGTIPSDDSPSSGKSVTYTIKANVNEKGGGGTVTGTVTTTDGYVLKDIKTREYSTEELSKLSNAELCIAYWETAAEYGLEFKNKGLSKYFKAQDWYTMGIKNEKGNGVWRPLKKKIYAENPLVKTNREKIKKLLKSTDEGKRWLHLDDDKYSN